VEGPEKGKKTPLRLFASTEEGIEEKLRKVEQGGRVKGKTEEKNRSKGRGAMQSSCTEKGQGGSQSGLSVKEEKHMTQTDSFRDLV